MKKYIPCFSIILSLVISAVGILYSLIFKKGMPFFPIIFLPSILGVIGLCFAEYNKNKTFMKISNSLVAFSPYFTFQIILQIID